MDPIQSVGVIGAGQMGSGIAQVAAQAGFEVLLHDLSGLTLARGIASIESIGLDTCLYIADVLHQEFGDDKYRPATILRSYVSAGWLGRKTGRGFYEYAS